MPSSSSSSVCPPVTPVVLPLGNLLSSSAVQTHVRKRRRALGLFSALPDNLIISVLERVIPTSHHSSQASLPTLQSFAQASTYAFAFACDEDLWRRLAFLLHEPSLLAHTFTHSWRHTVRCLALGKKDDTTRPRASVTLSPVYSDILFHKFRCRTASIPNQWLVHEDIPRLSAEQLSVREFRDCFERPRRPVILTDLVTKWDAFSKWTPESLSKAHPHNTFNAGGFQFTLPDYFAYARSVSSLDDQSLFIFDPTFATVAPQLPAQYTVPQYFSEDLFALLEHRRPHHRWLIIGPPRSGSSFHIDPNSTAAWNAAVVGRKKWLFFPPGVTPPGVVPSSDGADVVAPISVMEWFLNFYDRDVIRQAGALEAVVQPGELMFVPAGWWHCVLNLDLCIAVTQNFVSEVHVHRVVQWVRNRPAQVSGCMSLQDAQYLSSRFAELVVHRYPRLRPRLAFALENWQGEKRGSAEVCQNVSNEASQESGKKRKPTGLWQSLQTTDSSNNDAREKAAFTFGF